MRTLDLVIGFAVSAVVIAVTVILEKAKQLFFLALAVAVVWIALPAHQAIVQVQQSAKEIQGRIDGTSQNLNADLIQLGLTLDQVRLASTEERAYWRTTAKESAKTVRAVRQLIDRTDRSLNDDLMPQAASALGNVNEQVTQLGNAAVELGLVEQDLDRQVENPDIEATVASLKLTADHLAATSASLDATAADAKQYVHRITKPVSTAKRVGLALANFFGHVLGGWL